MIVDASIVVELILEEALLPWVERTLAALIHEPANMAWVNIAEAAVVVKRRRAITASLFEAAVAKAKIQPLTPDYETVRLVAEARDRFPLNFGDCFAYAHARQTGEALITLDADFLKTDLNLVFHPQSYP